MLQNCGAKLSCVATVEPNFPTPKCRKIQLSTFAWLVCVVNLSPKVWRKTLIAFKLHSLLHLTQPSRSFDPENTKFHLVPLLPSPSWPYCVQALHPVAMLGLTIPPAPNLGQDKLPCPSPTHKPSMPYLSLPIHPCQAPKPKNGSGPQAETHGLTWTPKTDFPCPVCHP